MANVTTLHQLKASAQYMGEGMQRVVDRIARALLAGDERADGLSVYRSNTVTTTGAVVKASAGKLYAAIIEPATTAATGTGGTGFLHLYNAESLNGPWAAGGTTFMHDAIRFVTGMTRAVTFDPAAVDNTDLYNSGISVAVCTTHSGSTAVASLPKLTLVYS